MSPDAETELMKSLKFMLDAALPVKSIISDAELKPLRELRKIVTSAAAFNNAILPKAREAEEAHAALEKGEPVDFDPGRRFDYE